MLHNSVPLSPIIFLFLSLLIIGMGLTIPLFKYNFPKFFHSSLFIKIIMWVPLFVVFVLTLLVPSSLQLAVLLLILLGTGIEITFKNLRPPQKRLQIIYFLALALGLGHLIAVNLEFSDKFIGVLITIVFATVLSDVFAFFFGNYLGKHKLPKALNPNKSWEGVMGELVGAAIGVVLVNLFIIPVVSIWMFLPIGLGSALGDLANSFVKRKVNIKEWSQSLPGHGGFTDRFSSMAGSSTLLFYFLKFHL